jgi:hypothetical protein
MTAFRLRVFTIALSIAFEAIGASCFKQPSVKDQRVRGAQYSSMQMADGKQWMTENLNVNIDQSYCYEDAELNCGLNGRLYTWQSAQRRCQSLGTVWRLSTNAEWQQLAKHYGGLRDDSDDGGTAAFKALLLGGSTGFNPLQRRPHDRWPVRSPRGARILLDSISKRFCHCMVLQLWPGRLPQSA